MHQGDEMHIAYDEESFPNLWTLHAAAMDGNAEWYYEISGRRDDSQHLLFDLLSGRITRMLGFNSLTYDYPLLHHAIGLIRGGYTGEHLANLIYQRSQALIEASREEGWSNRIWPRDVLVEQVDLFLLHHLDRMGGSLKEIEFNIHAPSIEECPVPFGTWLTPEQMDMVIGYGRNDTRETKRFAHRSKDAITFREDIIKRGWFGVECLSWNDGKIGGEYFKRELEKKAPGLIKREPVHRDVIYLADCIVPYVQYERPELRNMLAKLQTIRFPAHAAKGAYKEVVTIDGFTFDIGAGGIHGSVARRVVTANDGYVIADIDVTGYYPSVAIANRFHPEHLGDVFCDVYRDVRDTREVAKKAGLKVEAGTLKLSSNKVFGDFGSQHSVFRDPQCMIKVTINGQLLQVMLAEQLLRIPTLELLQMNTDGLAVRLHATQVHNLEQSCGWWERMTCLRLEFKEYAAMWIRDVNNYMAMEAPASQPVRSGWEKHKGAIKRKGDYDHEMLSGSTGGQLAWHRDFSGLVIPKAAEAAFIHDIDPTWFIANHDDPYDFMMRGRVKGASRFEQNGAELQKVIRYYIATGHPPLTKVMPPLKGQPQPRRSGVHAEGQATCAGSRKDGYRCSACGAPFPTKGVFEEHNKQVHAWGVRVVNRWVPEDGLPGLDTGFYIQRAEALLF
jgi:hypothetical protein